LALTVGGWAAWRIFGPETTPRYPPRQERPLRIPGRTVFVGEREFFVRETGPEDGPPLVLVHGWSLDGEMTFHRLVPDLAEEYRVIIPDLRNHGRSDWIRSEFAIEDMATDLAGVLDSLGVRGATVVGYSLGGMVAQSLVLTHPRFVRRLVLAATAARPVHRFRAVVWIALRLLRSVARISRIELSLGTTTIVLRSGGVSPRHVRWLFEGLMRRDPTLHPEAGFAAWRFDNRKAVRHIDVPTLVIIPTADQLVRPAAQYELAGLLTDPEVIELHGARHESILATPDVYLRAITDFASR
jgi:pimeloyl-ACP methyl ester carboxylesterase